MNRMFVVSVIGVLAVALSTAVFFGTRSADYDDPAETSGPPVKRKRDAESKFSATRPVTAEKQAVSSNDAPDAALLAHIEYKYRYLFADVNRAYLDELKRRLLEREREAQYSIEQAQIDARIAELLPARDLAYYRALKDSDLEQHHLAEYVGGISNILPLDEQQERQVLDAKLRQKQRYATALRDLGIDRDALSPAEREYAHTHLAEALKGYLEEFLLEVSPALTPEQYTLLRNYETTEFARELARLQQLINAK
jgi:hypothetical protein